MDEQTTGQRQPASNTQGGRRGFNRAEWHALRTMRQSYHPGHDFFTPAQLEHLRFVRWLHQAGRSAG